jgi:hypothetical protein
MHRLTSTICAAALMAGCASHWQRPATTYREFAADSRQCAADAQRVRGQVAVATIPGVSAYPTMGIATTSPAVRLDKRHYRNCMTHLGYERGGDWQGAD